MSSFFFASDLSIKEFVSSKKIPERSRWLSCVSQRKSITKYPFFKDTASLYALKALLYVLG